MGGHAACTGQKKIAYKVLVVKPEDKHNMKYLSHMWEHNIKMNLKKIHIVTCLGD
jgi:hypothetical protein